MSSLTTACIVFGCVFGSALLATFVRQALPDQHLNTDSRDVVKLGMGLVATLAALVLGLLVAAAKGTFDAQTTAIRQMSVQVMLLGRGLAHYGPETKEVRELLRKGMTATRDNLWPRDRAEKTTLAPGIARVEMEGLFDKVAALEPKTEVQRVIRGRAMDVTVDIGQTRFRLFAQKDSSIPLPFFVVLVFWLTILFAGYGLLAPRNLTVIAALLVCALSISGAVFLILELDKPFDGIVHVSSAPLDEVLARLGE